MDSIEEVQARFDLIVLGITASPIVCEGAPEPVDQNTFLGAIQPTLYHGRQKYGELVKGALQMEAALLTGDHSEVCAGATASKLKKREDAPKEGDDGVLVISAVDMAGRYPWKTYEEFEAASEALEATAPYGAWGYAALNGYVTPLLFIVCTNTNFIQPVRCRLLGHDPPSQPIRRPLRKRHHLQDALPRPLRQHPRRPRHPHVLRPPDVQALRRLLRLHCQRPRPRLRERAFQVRRRHHC